MPHIVDCSGEGSRQDCPNCGSSVWPYNKHDMINPHPDAFNIEADGLTLREWGISRPGVYYTERCGRCRERVLLVMKRYTTEERLEWYKYYDSWGADSDKPGFHDY